MAGNLPAAIDGFLVRVHQVDGARSLKLTIHVPDERAEEVIACFGWPTGARPVPVAIARLETRSAADDPVLAERKPDVRRDGGASGSGEETPGPVPSASAPPATHKRMATSQRAWLLCESPDFQRWLGVPNGTRAADRMRVICNVTSRSQLDLSPSARSRYDTLTADFEAWQREQA